MSNEDIKVVQFQEDNYPQVVQIANELAELEQRKAHDSIRRLIEEEGPKKIERLRAEKEKAEASQSRH